MQAVGKEICLGIVSTKDATYQKFCKWMLKKGRVYIGRHLELGAAELQSLKEEIII